MTRVPHASLEELVVAATLAPSSHNTQPWRFRVSGSTIELFADRVRALPVNDPDDRELTISCGAALFNLRVAAAHAGLAADVVLWPDGDGDRVACVELRHQGDAAQADGALHASLALRRTCRQPFADRIVGAPAIQRLIDAAAAEGARLVAITGDESRRAVAGLVSEGDAAQWGDPGWRRELAAWMHPRRSGDGLSMSGLPVPVTQLVVRTFDMGGRQGAKDRALAEGSPLLALIETAHDTARDWVMAGQALERVLLTAYAEGLQASYLNQPIQVSALRPRLRDVVHSAGVPQLLVRLGHPRDASMPTPRRPLRDVMAAD